MGIELSAIEGLPEIGEGDDLAGLIAERVDLEDGDVVVISQKAVSKAEGRVRRLGEVTPGDRALELAAELGKDPALVELILAESRIDGPRRARRPDRRDAARAGSARTRGSTPRTSPATTPSPCCRSTPTPRRAAYARELREAAGVAPAVVVSDSFGRPWRIGQTDVAIGCAGLVAIDDWRGRADRDGRELAATAIAVADHLAAAADLARDKTSGAPAVRVRGAARLVTEEDGPGAAALQRPAEEDLFR